MNEGKVMKVLLEVLEERRRQHATFGEQNLPDLAGYEAGAIIQEATEVRSYAHRAEKDGQLSWTHVLGEEVAEAIDDAHEVSLHGGDTSKLRAELVQVAAVAVQWIEAIDRRGLVVVPDEPVVEYDVEG